jgi:hypothetical protein
MHQLQAWAEEERYDFEGKRFKTPYGWVDYDQLEPVSVQMTRAKEQGYRITQEGLDAIRYVLDGTIQVWRPVEHYPLIENNKPVILWRKGIRNGIVGVWSLEFGSCFTDCEWRDFKTQEIIEDIEDYTHWMPFEPPQEVSHA